jgi:pyrrolidone-carboxylate peptidase
MNEPEPTVEEDRLEVLAASGSEIPYRMLLDRAGEASGPSAAAGQRLWQTAVTALQAGDIVDDRALYWARLNRKAEWRAVAAEDALEQFERASRGFDDVRFPAAADAKRVLVTGFDPFHLDVHLDQSNPSGLAALSLDGRILATENGPAHVEAAVFPVRFEDFDAGMVEDFIEPHLADGVDLVVTISMGRDGFDLERFPGRRRSATGPDNLNVLTGASAETPLLPRLRGSALEGPEFLEFTLPAEAMTEVEGAFSVRDNRHVATVEHGDFPASSLSGLSDQTAVRGSGGGYLSNEIAYRSLLANRRVLGPDRRASMGHIHTPRLEGFDPGFEARVLEQLEALLIAAVEAATIP